MKDNKNYEMIEEEDEQHFTNLQHRLNEPLTYTDEDCLILYSLGISAEDDTRTESQ
jgi:hypothetical protein